MRVESISKFGIPDVIDKLRSLLTLLVGAETQDAPVSGKSAM